MNPSFEMMRPGAQSRGAFAAPEILSRQNESVAPEDRSGGKRNRPPSLLIKESSIGYEMGEDRRRSRTTPAHSLQRERSEERSFHTARPSSTRSVQSGVSGRFRAVDWQQQREISEDVVQEQMRRAASIHLERIRGGRRSTVFTRMTSLPESWDLRRSIEGDGLEEMSGRRDEESMHVPLHPHSVLKTFWDVAVCITTIMTLIVDPISLAFESQLNEDWYAVTDRIIMTIFSLDVFVNFLSGFTLHHENFRVELQWDKVALNYLSGWFVVDVAAALPAEAFNNVPQISMIRGARLVQAGVHAIKVSKVAGFAQRFRLNVDINLPPFVWKLVAWTVGLLLWLHLAACMQCWVWVDEDDQDYLAIDLEVGHFFILGEECLYRSQCISRYYLRAFRTACGFMLGHGQFSGHTVKEELMIVVCSLSGSVLYKSFMSMCIQLLMLMDSFRVKHYSASKELDKYMGRRKVPLELRFRARRYLESAWDKLGGLDEGQVLGIMSQGLRGNIRYECSVDLIRSVPFFEGASDNFIYRVAQVIKTDVFGAGDHLMLAGEFGLEMYLIKEGQVEVLDAEENRVCILGARDFFGENALANTLLRTSTVRALTEGMVFIIEKEDMQKIYQRFPAMHRQLLTHTQLKFGTLNAQEVIQARRSEYTPPVSPLTGAKPAAKITWKPTESRAVHPTPVKAMAESFKLTRNPYVE